MDKNENCSKLPKMTINLGISAHLLFFSNIVKPLVVSFPSLQLTISYPVRVRQASVCWSLQKVLQTQIILGLLLLARSSVCRMTTLETMLLALKNKTLY